MNIFYNIKHWLSIILIFSAFICKGGTFDNILKVIFYTDANQSYLILHESHYHVTSGAYEQGNMRSQGYNSSKIIVFNLQNGHIVAQKDMGTMDSVSACFILGCSANNLWIYNHKFKSGVQSLNPITLKRSISQAKIYGKLNTSIGQFMQPEWHKTKEFYAYDEIQQKLIVTNANKKQYYIDINTFSTEPIKEKLLLNIDYNNYLTSDIQFKDSIWELDGYDLTKFKCGAVETAKPNYLYGQFILDQNKLRLFKHFFNIQENIVTNNNTLSTKQNEELKTSQTNIQSIIKGRKSDEVLLQPDVNTFFVLSKSKQSADAVIQISKIKSTKFGNFNEQWSVKPPGMFYNVAQARNTVLFRKHFGDIYPEFDYKFIQMHDNKLVVIYLLYVSCIDIDSGEILWQQRLK